MSLWCCLLGVLCVSVAGCRRASPPPGPPLPPVSGTLVLDGLSAPVRVVRDRWGVPHIYAASQDDLFFAQGFVQAEDRLFQMDLWRRAAQGRLSEVLGSNFVERDAMTRRMQYRGDLDAEWASYGADTRAIAAAFVRGVNAWVAIARATPPEAFVLAGWQPEFWTPEDLLNRTEAFTMSQQGLLEVLRARLVQAVGVRRADELMPPDPPVATVVPPGLDLGGIDARIGDALRRVGTAPFFLGLAAPVRSVEPGSHDGSNNWAVAGRRSADGAPILANDPHRHLDHPSLRYLVHLSAPGWNVIGSTEPWMPGVAIGHNDRIAWGLTIFDADGQDLYVERVNPANPHQVMDRGRWVSTTRVPDPILVKGREKPFPGEHEFTRHGPIVATDRERHLAYVLRWSGAEPGTAGYLAAPAIDRARSWPEFREALSHWKAPGEHFVYADVDGNIGYQAAALVPIRRGWTGTLPAPGWSGAYEWRGWYALDDLPHAFNPPDGYLATANNDTLDPGDRRAINFEWGSPARINRIREVFAATPTFSVDASRRLQHDVLAWNAEQLVPLLGGVTADRPEIDAARRRLLAWDRRLTAESSDASLYVLWESALARRLARGPLDAALATDYLASVDGTLVPALTKPSPAWFAGDPVRSRDALLVAALGDALADLNARTGGDPRKAPWGRLHTATFEHPLAATAAARRLFDVGPFARPGYGDTVMATYGSGLSQEGGASFREVIDLADWDRSVATSAPGQSESPASPHFADLAKLWAAGDYFPLAFSDAAVGANAEATLTLTPRR